MRDCWNLRLRGQSILPPTSRPSAFELAAAYAFGLARNHPFVDGNKRIALIAAFTFLELNGWEVQAEETAAVLVFVDLAAGKLDERQLAVWLEGNSSASAG